MLRFRAVSLCVAVAAAAQAQTYTFTKETYIPPPAYSVAVDAAGNQFISSTYTPIIRVSPAGIATAYASGRGAADGTLATAKFYNPSGMVFDAAGNLFVVDCGNNAIREITPAGVVTTFAGQLGGPAGSVDGTGSGARFNAPTGLAIDSAGNLYVADTGNNTLRKITPAAVVTTLAGTAGGFGKIDGLGAAARFNLPQGIAVDAAGNVFVADTGNHAIRKISPVGLVSTLAGLSGNRGGEDGTGALARFDSPMGLTVDAQGRLFVADGGGNGIRLVTATGVVSTLSPSNSVWQWRGVALDGSGTLHALDGNYLWLGVPSDQVAITRPPQGQSVAAGSTYLLKVTATGAAPLTYRWQKDGVAIPGATSATLALNAVQASDSGAYTVAVTNAVGTALSSSATITVVAALANDNFADAAPLSGDSGSISGNNSGATGEPLEPTHNVYAATRSSVWYRWAPSQNGTAKFTIAPGGHMSATVAVYTGTTLTDLVPAGDSYGSFRATAGLTYYIAVGGAYDGARGAFTLNWKLVPNDDFANATLLSGDSGGTDGTSIGATFEPGEVHIGQSSVWYRWTPSQTGTVQFGALSSIIMPAGLTVAVYTGTTLDTLQEVPGSIRNLDWTLAPVVAGTTYYVAVYSVFGATDFKLARNLSTAPVITGFSASPDPLKLLQGTAFTWTVTAMSPGPLTYQWTKDGVAIAGATTATLSLPSVQVSDAGNYAVLVTNANGTTKDAGQLRVLIPPANDAFADATGIAGVSGSITGTNATASGEPGEPIHWNVFGTASSVWYKWTAPSSGLAVIDTTGSPIDTVLAVYTGTSLGTLSRLVQDDDSGGGHASRVSFSATAGTTYYIAVGGATSAARGNLTVNWQLAAVLAIVTPPANQTVAVGGSATFSVNATGAGATYQWYRNGTAIPGATDATLSLANIEAGDDASYTVTVANGSGSVTSAPATLAVAAPQLTTLSIRNVLPSGPALWSIAGGPTRLVTVGTAGTILSSADGRTWVSQVSGTTVWLVGVTYGGGRFVAVGDNGVILTSLDGQTWAPAQSSGTAYRLNNVIYAAGRFVAVGEGGTIVTSEDGDVWTPRSSGVTGWLHGLAYNAAIGQFATSGQGGVFLYSADGVTWNSLPISGLTDDLEAVVPVSSYAQFVAIGSSGTVVAIHQNALVLKTGDKLTTWTADVGSTGSALRFRGLATGASALFASGEGGKVVTANQAAGPWLTLPTGTTANLFGGTYYNNTLYLVGENATVVQSDPLYSSRLMNISTRCNVGTGDNVLISGFVVTGTAPKQVLIRAAGPALAAAPFNIAGTLSSPLLTLYDVNGHALATNAGWSTAANADAIASVMPAVGAFPFATGSGDCAILTTLPPGSYTAQVAGANGATGISLVEVYDTEGLATQTAQAVNLSSRGAVGSGDSKLIAGFVINGASARRVLIRAAGPALAAAPFNLSGTLAQPKLELYNSKGLLRASAGAWGLQPNADEIRGSAAAVGAFPLADGSTDAAMVVTLLPGAWTVQVSGADATTGIVITEIYVLP